MKLETLLEYANDNAFEFYHVSSSKNRTEILKKGLIPKIGKNSKTYGESAPAIYLFASIEDAKDAVMNWLGDEFDDNDILDLYEINLPADFHVEHEAFEYRTTDSIPPHYIKLITTDF